MKGIVIADIEGIIGVENFNDMSKNCVLMTRETQYVSVLKKLGVGKITNNMRCT